MEWIAVPALKADSRTSTAEEVDRWTLVGICMELAAVSLDEAVIQAWDGAVRQATSEPVEVLLNRHRQPVAVTRRSRMA